MSWGSQPHNRSAKKCGLRLRYFFSNSSWPCFWIKPLAFSAMAARKNGRSTSIRTLASKTSIAPGTDWPIAPALNVSVSPLHV